MRIGCVPGSCAFGPYFGCMRDSGNCCFGMSELLENWALWIQFPVFSSIITEPTVRQEP